MALEEPYLPQAENNVITGTLIRQGGGVQINVAVYFTAAYGDIIRFYWGGGYIGYINVPAAPQFPLVFIIPSDLVADGSFTLSYSVEDTAKNISRSPVIVATIAGHTAPRMSIEAAILTNNALANGVSQNRIGYTVRTHTRAAGATGDFLALNANKTIIFTTSGSAVLSPGDRQTDRNGHYELGITSQQWGVDSVRAFLNGALNLPIITTQIYFLTNYRFDVKQTLLDRTDAQAEQSETYRVVITLYNRTTNQPIPSQSLTITGLGNNEQNDSGLTDANGSFVFLVHQPEAPALQSVDFQVSLTNDASVYDTFSVNFRPR